MPTLSEVQESLTQALSEAAKAQKAYEDAHAKIEPLRQAADQKQKAVDALMAQYQKMRGSDGAAPTRRKSSGAPRKQTAEGRFNRVVGAKLRSWKRQHPKASDGQLEKQRAKIAEELRGAK
jgi:hypothetical protein